MFSKGHKSPMTYSTVPSTNNPLEDGCIAPMAQSQGFQMHCFTRANEAFVLVVRVVRFARRRLSCMSCSVPPSSPPDKMRSSIGQPGEAGCVWRTAAGASETSRQTVAEAEAHIVRN